MAEKWAERPGRPRPSVVLFDVFETLLQLQPLRQRFVDVDRPAHELDVFFARTLRDGMAYTLAGAAPPFADLARETLRALGGGELTEAGIDHILAGFRELPVHPDVVPALEPLNDAGIPAYALTHGSAEIASAALEKAGVLARLRGVLSAEDIQSFKPPPKVYHWACQQAGSAPETTALVAAHSWDTHGAVCAGLLAGFVTRLEGRLPATARPPHVVADRLDEVVRDLLH